MTVAVKTNPRLWESAKKAACSQAGLCKHSARKMQWATRYYKRKGGRYKGKRSASNSLTRWGKQKWRTYSGKKSGGKLRYLPSRSWKRLSKSQIRRTNAAKRRGYSKGKARAFALAILRAVQAMLEQVVNIPVIHLCLRSVHFFLTE